MDTVEEYLAQLPADRRDAIARVRDVVNANLPAGYEERMSRGMIARTVPSAPCPPPTSTTSSRCASPGSRRRRATWRST